MSGDIGTCKLTGAVGPFVKAHLLPAAFVKRTSSAPFMEADQSSPWLKRRFTGWYDPAIVTRPGEDILSELDDYAAKIFIQRGYTYRERRSSLDFNDIHGGYAPNRIYTIADIDPARLRRFGLSLLWRFAVSRHGVADSVSVPPKRRQTIETILRGGVDDWRRFPVYFALASDGDELVKMAPVRVKAHPFIRFFLDGIVCYASPWERHQSFPTYEPFFAGHQDDRIDLWCFDSTSSDHNRYVNETMAQVMAKHGNPFEKRSRS